MFWLFGFFVSLSGDSPTMTIVFPLPPSSGFSKTGMSTPEYFFPLVLNFGFIVTTSRIVTYNKDGVRIDIHLDSSGMFDMFTEYVFLCKDHVVKNDWYHPKTIKEFLDIFNEYTKYIQHNS